MSADIYMDATGIDGREWEGIFLPSDTHRAVMSMPPRMRASRLFVREVADSLDLDDDAALQAADWIADKMERFGAAFAQPVFDMDGNGPICSWCTTIWPLCGHHHLSAMLTEAADRGLVEVSS